MAHGYWLDEHSPFFKKAKRQTKMYYELLGGDNAKCGKDSVEEAAWDAVLAERRKAKEAKEKLNALKYIAKHDKNGDGKLDETDYKENS